MEDREAARSGNGAAMPPVMDQWLVKIQCLPAGQCVDHPQPDIVEDEPRLREGECLTQQICTERHGASQKFAADQIAQDPTAEPAPFTVVGVVDLRPILVDEYGIADDHRDLWAGGEGIEQNSGFFRTPDVVLISKEDDVSRGMGKCFLKGSSDSAVDSVPPQNNAAVGKRFDDRYRVVDGTIVHDDYLILKR